MAARAGLDAHSFYLELCHHWHTAWLLADSEQRKPARRGVRAADATRVNRPRAARPSGRPTRIARDRSRTQSCSGPFRTAASQAPRCLQGDS
jgi:hypothetical protein